jgi:Na+/H+ antiporter NhaD/arsenite permease-like protein
LPAIYNGQRRQYIIVVESARPDVHVSFWDYFRAGAPITAATLLAGWAWLAWIR